MKHQGKSGPRRRNLNIGLGWLVGWALWFWVATERKVDPRLTDLAGFLVFTFPIFMGIGCSHQVYKRLKRQHPQLFARLKREGDFPYFFFDRRTAGDAGIERLKSALRFWGRCHFLAVFLFLFSMWALTGR